MADVQDQTSVTDELIALIVADEKPKRKKEAYEKKLGLIIGASGIKEHEQVELLNRILRMKYLEKGLYSAHVSQVSGLRSSEYLKLINNMPTSADNIRAHINNKYDDVVSKTADKSGMDETKLRQILGEVTDATAAQESPIPLDKPEIKQMQEEPKPAEPEIEEGDNTGNTGVQDPEDLNAILAQAQTQAQTDEAKADDATPEPDKSQGEIEDAAGDADSDDAKADEEPQAPKKPLEDYVPQMAAIVTAVMDDDSHPLHDTEIGQAIRAGNQPEGIEILRHAVLHAASSDNAVSAEDMIETLAGGDKDSIETVVGSLNTGHDLHVGVLIASVENNPLPYIRALLRSRGIELHSQIELGELVAKINERVPSKDSAAQAETKTALQMAMDLEKKEVKVDVNASRMDQLEELADGIIKATGLNGPLILAGHEDLTTLKDGNKQDPVESAILDRINALREAGKDDLANSLQEKLNYANAAADKKYGQTAQAESGKTFRNLVLLSYLQKGAEPSEENLEESKEIASEALKKGTADKLNAMLMTELDKIGEDKSAPKADQEKPSDEDAKDTPAAETEQSEKILPDPVKTDDDPTGMDEVTKFAANTLVKMGVNKNGSASKLYTKILSTEEKLVAQAEKEGKFKNELEKDVFRNLILLDKIKHNQVVMPKAIDSYLAETRNIIEEGRVDSLSQELQDTLESELQAIKSGDQIKHSKNGKVTDKTELTKDNYKEVIEKKYGVNLKNIFGAVAPKKGLLNIQTAMMGLGAGLGFLIGGPTGALLGLSAGRILGNLINSGINRVGMQALGKTALMIPLALGAYALAGGVAASIGIPAVVTGLIIGGCLGLAGHLAFAGRSEKASIYNDMRNAGFSEEEAMQMVKDTRAKRALKAIFGGAFVGAVMAGMHDAVAMEAANETTPSDEVDTSNWPQIPDDDGADMPAGAAASGAEQGAGEGGEDNGAPEADEAQPDEATTGSPEDADSGPAATQDDAGEPEAEADAGTDPSNDGGGAGDATPQNDNPQADDAIIPAETHQIVSGDTLSQLVSDKYGVSLESDEMKAMVEVIAQENGISDIHQIQVGQEIVLPDSDALAESLEGHEVNEAQWRPEAWGAGTEPATPTAEAQAGSATQAPSAREVFDAAANTGGVEQNFHEVAIIPEGEIRTDLTVEQARAILVGVTDADSALAENVEQSLIQSLDRIYAQATASGDTQLADRAIQASGEVSIGSYQSAMLELTDRSAAETVFAEKADEMSERPVQANNRPFGLS